MSDWTKSREIHTRLVIRGDLVLDTPAHLGNGDSDGTVDLQLTRDSVGGGALLAGTSIAGALRAELHAHQEGYGVAEEASQRATSYAALLFGGSKRDDDGAQSPLIIDDAIGQPFVPEVRDGVKINPQRRTAEDKGKYDIELLPPGTSFPLRFELLLAGDNEHCQRVRAALAEALESLEQGRIAIGARRSRGYGKARVTGWQVATYNLSDPHQLLAWLKREEPSGVPQPIRTIVQDTLVEQDQRCEAELIIQCDLASPILIRSEQPLTGGDNDPDFIHLRNALEQPIIPGTSLAGVLRARAGRILRLLQPASAEERLNALFGQRVKSEDKQPTGSRILIDEVLITGGNPLVQSRVAIDRFTGGALDTALFAEAPHVGGAVQLRLRIRNPQEHELGLLLLLLKDLWTSDLPIGGASSVGRGRLQGTAATLRLHDPAIRNDDGTIRLRKWDFAATPAGGVQVSNDDPAILEDWVKALHRGGA